MSTEFKIENGIPSPRPGVGRKNKYPFREMLVGQSFFIPESEVGGVRSSAIYFTKNNKHYRFVCAKTNDPAPGVRVWRVAL